MWVPSAVKQPQVLRIPIPESTFTCFRRHKVPLYLLLSGLFPFMGLKPLCVESLLTRTSSDGTSVCRKIRQSWWKMVQSFGAFTPNLFASVKTNSLSVCPVSMVCLGWCEICQWNPGVDHISSFYDSRYVQISSMISKATLLIYPFADCEICSGSDLYLRPCI